MHNLFSKLRKSVFLLLLAFWCIKPLQAQEETTSIAFLADVHLQDVFGKLSETDFQGPLLPGTTDHVLMRTMEAQLHSTRLFNENYFAFTAALEDLAARGIHWVALPGDYTDDGQPLNLKGLYRLLRTFETQYDLRFFITTGNHDPAVPFATPAGKTDFLGENGKPQPVFSEEGMYTPKADEHSVIVSPDIAKMGYSGVLDALGSFGFMPRPEYAYWATPFSRYTPQEYTYAKALQDANLKERQYPVTPDTLLPDLSYVVELNKDIWLLALDGDVFVPDGKGGFEGAGTGYNRVLSHKKHLITWVEKLSKQADALGKKLIAFSHFPMIDFNDDASGEIEALMGASKFQLYRVPDEAVAEAFADAGLKIHVGGHMHINDTGRRTTPAGNTLINIQTPSPAAYFPAYKILHIGETGIEVETVRLSKVTGFKTLFPLYKTEYRHLKQTRQSEVWNPAILEVSDYNAYTTWHLRELIRLRFLPGDFPQTLRNFLPEMSLEHLLLLAYQTQEEPETYLKRLQNQPGFAKKEWKRLQPQRNTPLKRSILKKLSGADLIYDFYRLRGGDDLAKPYITANQLALYEHLYKSFSENRDKYPNSELGQQLQLLMHILHRFHNGQPSDHFKIDWETGKLERL